MKHAIDALTASKRKATHQRDNWKARAIALEKELNAYKVWAAKVDRWHTQLCTMCGVEPVHPAQEQLSCCAMRTDSTRRGATTRAS